MGLSGAFNQCIFSLVTLSLLRQRLLINLKALYSWNVFVVGGGGGGRLGCGCKWGGGSWVTEAVVILSNITP